MQIQSDRFPLSASIDRVALPKAPLTSEDVIGLLGQDYQLPRNTLLLEDTLRHLQYAFGSLENVAGKRVLDIGCGSRSCREGRLQLPQDRSLFEPWLCRAVVLLGGEAVGVDKYETDEESDRFRFVKLDLMKPRALDVLGPDHSFDGVNTRLFLSSPDLELSTTLEQRAALREEIRRQMKRLVKLDGKLICFDEVLVS